MVKHTTQDTKACTGVYIHNGTVWECFDLLIRHIPTNPSCISSLLRRAECPYVCVTNTYTQTDTDPLQHDKKMPWQSATLCIDRVQCYQLTWFCYVWHDAQLCRRIATDLLGTRPATESCAARVVQPTPARLAVGRI